MYTPTQRLMRSRTERVVAGVAGGIATYLAIDPVIVRLAFVALVFAGVGLLLYPILWLIMPAEGAQAAAPGEAVREMRSQFTHVGEQVREVFADEAEIPIENRTPPAGTSPAARGQQLGILLLGIGALALAGVVLGPGFGKMAFPLLLIAGGFLVLRRGQ